MRKTFMLAALIFLMGCKFHQKKNIEVSESDYKQAEVAFAELKETLKSDNGRLWNHTLDGPVLLINRETRIIIANEPDPEGELIKQGDFFVGEIPGNVNIANTSVDWNGKRWTMVAFPLPGLKPDRLSLLIHESFHRIQPYIGFDSLIEVQCSHLDTKEGRIYLKLELEALKKALNSDNPEMHLKNALLFRQHRQQLFPGAKKSENSLEINEGLAEYTGTVLCGRTADELRRYYVTKIDWFYGLPTFVRSFAYFTIPVYGYFMQQTDRTWNLKIHKQTNLTDFILDFYQVRDSKPGENEILLIGKSYRIDSIIQFEQTREVRRLAQVTKYRSQFLGNSYLKIGLENMNFGFNPGNLVPLDSFGTVYPSVRITDNWGILEVDSCGALMSSDFKYVTVSAPEKISDTLVRGKGWKLKLAKPWKLEKEQNKYKLTK